jgi:hypothetical protein
VREFIQAMVEGELDAALMRPRYGRRSQSSSGDADGPVDVTGQRGGRPKKSGTSKSPPRRRPAYAKRLQSSKNVKNDYKGSA